MIAFVYMLMISRYISEVVEYSKHVVHSTQGMDRSYCRVAVYLIFDSAHHINTLSLFNIIAPHIIHTLNRIYANYLSYTLKRSKMEKMWLTRTKVFNYFFSELFFIFIIHNTKRQVLHTNLQCGYQLLLRHGFFFFFFFALLLLLI